MLAAWQLLQHSWQAFSKNTIKYIIHIKALWHIYIVCLSIWLQYAVKNLTTAVGEKAELMCMGGALCQHYRFLHRYKWLTILVLNLNSHCLPVHAFLSLSSLSGTHWGKWFLWWFLYSAFLLYMSLQSASYSTFHSPILHANTSCLIFTYNHSLMNA